MSPSVKKWLMAVAGAAIVGAPAAFPVLAPFASFFQIIGAAVSGGALIRSPGDAPKGK
jgi:hypothetical protein